MMLRYKILFVILIFLNVLSQNQAAALSVDDVVQNLIESGKKQNPNIIRDFTFYLAHPTAAQQYIERTTATFYNHSSPDYSEILKQRQRISQIIWELVVGNHMSYKTVELTTIWNNKRLIIQDKQTIGMLLYANDHEASMAAAAMSGDPSWFTLFAKVKDPKAEEIFYDYCVNCEKELFANCTSKPFAATLAMGYGDALSALTNQKVSEYLWKSYIDLFPDLMPLVQSDSSPYPVQMNQKNMRSLLDSDPEHFSQWAWMLFTSNHLTFINTVKNDPDLTDTIQKVIQNNISIRLKSIK